MAVRRADTAPLTLVPAAKQPCNRRDPHAQLAAEPNALQKHVARVRRS